MAEITGSEDALMRHNFVSGTHTLTTALFGVLRPGDVMLSITGLPDDTIQPVIGHHRRKLRFAKRVRHRVPPGRSAARRHAGSRSHCRSGKGSPRRSGVCTALPRLFPAALHQHGHDGKADSDGAGRRSQGDFHCWIPAMEFLPKRRKPTQLGAGFNCSGSLDQNAGGGIARTGGNTSPAGGILIEQCAYRLTTPGQGKEIGCTLGELRNMFFRAVFSAERGFCSAVKTAIFALLRCSSVWGTVSDPSCR